MIAEIGIIIGFYIITRMLSFLLRKEKRAENIAVKILAIITIIITVIVIADLFLRGMQISSSKQISSLFQQEHKTNQIFPEDNLRSEVEGLAERIRLAHLNKDIDKWIDCYAPDYPKRSQLKNSILELWKNHDVKEVSYRISNIQRQGDRQASAVIVWSFQVYDQRSHDYQLLRQAYKVTLEKTNGDWKIKDSKEEVEPKA